MKDDVISRQAAIDVLMKLTPYKNKRELVNRCDASIADAEGRLGGIAECIDEIEDLPSAQPEPCEDAVSRQALYDALMAEPLKWNDSSVWESARCHQWMMDMDAIKALPSVTPKPRTGKWYKPVGMMPPEYAGVYRCSKCDEIAMRDWKHHKQVLSNFCPNCGSYNGGEQDESI